MADLPIPPADLLDRASLFLDFDGTLADFVDPDERPVVEQRTADLLRALSRRLDRRIAIVSGRSLGSLIELIEVEEIDLTGSHGLERRSAAGGLSSASAAGAMGSLHAEGRRLGKAFGVIVEEKPAGAAFHYRNNPDVQHRIAVEVEKLAKRHRLEFREGSMVFEVRAPGPHKGDAVRTLMAEAPFDMGVPLFIGDDITDEDGFAAARDLGGHGILVGAPRDTAANFRLPSVAHTLEWLAQ